MLPAPDPMESVSTAARWLRWIPSRATLATLIERFPLRATVARARVLSRSFLDPRAFSKPESWQEALARARHNAYQYYIFYAAAVLAVLLYTILSSPWLIVGVSLLSGAWFYSFVVLGADAPLVACGMKLERREKLLVLVPFSALVVAITGLIGSLLWAIIASFVVTIPHATMHQVTELDALDALELEGLQNNPFPEPGIPAIPNL
mgnify:FL=1